LDQDDLGHTHGSHPSRADRDPASRRGGDGGGIDKPQQPRTTARLDAAQAYDWYSTAAAVHARRVQQRHAQLGNGLAGLHELVEPGAHGLEPVLHGDHGVIGADAESRPSASAFQHVSRSGGNFGEGGRP
jgi:hypothetical protein